MVFKIRFRKRLTLSILLCTVSPLSTQKLTNLIEVLQAIHQNNPSGQVVSQSPAVWSVPGAPLCSAPFVPTPNVFTGVPYSLQSGPIACQGGLQFINVGLTDQAAKNYLAFTFNISSNPTLQTLAQQGLYIAINMYTSQNINYAQVALTEKSGNIHSQITYQLPANVGFLYANIGFNMSDTAVPPAKNQTYVDWFQISSQQRIYYSDQGASTAATTQSVGSQTIGGTVSSGTPPPSKTIPTIFHAASFIRVPQSPATWSIPSGAQCSAPFVVTPKALTGPVYSLQNNTAINCTSGLDFITIGLSDMQHANWLNFYFDTKSTSLQGLAAQGMYLVINQQTYVQGSNMIQIALTDQAGNVYSEITFELDNNVGFAQAYVGWNMKSTSHKAGANQTYTNAIPIGTFSQQPRLFYQQSSGATTSPIGLSDYKASVVSQSPASWSAPAGTPLCSAPFAVTQDYLTGPTFNSIPVNCPFDLNFINVGLTDSSAKNFLTFVFQIKSNPSLAALAIHGLYIACGMVVINGVNNAQVALTDASGNIYSVINFALPANVGFTQANIGFNVNDTDDVSSTQNAAAQVNVPLGQRVYYLQNAPAAVAAEKLTPGTGQAWN